MIKLLSFIVVMLIAVNNVDAQSKKELKEQAKIQTVVDATTTRDGTRFFSIKSTHISFYVKRCYHFDNAVMVDMLVQNRNGRDEHLTLYGRNGEYSYKTNAVDENDRYYSSSNFYFAKGSSKDFKGSLDDVLVPAQGVLKLTMKVDNVKSDISKLKELNFGYEAALEGITLTRPAKMLELIITN